MSTRTPRPEGPLAAVVTGMERSGTTFLAALAAVHPEVEGGFECGLLLAARPRGFSRVRPFFEWMQHPVERGHWGVPAEGMERICGSPDWRSAYAALREGSPVFARGGAYVLDKTPAYLPRLDAVLEKAPGVPCFVSWKEPLLQYYSYKKRGLRLSEFLLRYWRCRRGLRLAQRRFGGRIRVVSHEEAWLHPLRIARAVSRFIGLPYPGDGVARRRLSARLGRFGWRMDYDLARERRRALGAVSESESRALRQAASDPDEALRIVLAREGARLFTA